MLLNPKGQAVVTFATCQFCVLKTKKKLRWSFYVCLHGRQCLARRSRNTQKTTSTKRKFMHIAKDFPHKGHLYMYICIVCKYTSHNDSFICVHSRALCGVDVVLVNALVCQTKTHASKSCSRSWLYLAHGLIQCNLQCVGMRGGQIKPPLLFN